MPDGFAVDLYEDPATGAYLRAVIDPEGSPKAIAIDRYARIGTNQRAIAAWHDEASGDSTALTYTPNVHLTDAQLHPPAATATWTFGSALPFGLKNTDGGVVVDAAVNGVRGHFLLDSLSTTIELGKEFAARAKVQPLAKRPDLAKIDSLAFDGGSTLTNVVVTTTYADPLGRDDVDGVLGFDFFAGAVVDLDLDGGRMTLFDPATFAVNPSSSIASLDLSRGIPIVRATADKRILVDALVDTTGGDAIALPPALADRIELNQAPGATTPANSARCGILTHFQIGIVSYDDQAACFAQAPGSEALLGYEFLRQLNVTFDYPDAAIVMVPRSRNPQAPPARKSPGP